MDRKIALPVGFAVVALLAVVGVLAMFSFTAPQPTEASNLDTGNLDLGQVDPGKLTEPFGEPIKGTYAVTGGQAGPPSIVNSPRDPGAAARFTIRFNITDDLVPGVDEIIIDWKKDFGIPDVIPESGVTIRADSVTGDGAPGSSVNPESVTVSRILAGDDQFEIALLVPDMDPADGSGGNGIAADALVTVVFRQSAGLTNNEECTKDPVADFAEAGGEDVTVRVTLPGGADPLFDANVFLTDLSTGFAEGLITPCLIDMDSDDGNRGGTIGLLAKGVDDGKSVTFWLDEDGDGIRDFAERDLCTVTSDDNKTAFCDAPINNPPFHPGTAEALVVSGSLLDGDYDPADFPTVTVDDSADFKVGQTIEIDNSGAAGSEQFLITALPTGTTLTVATAAVEDHNDNLPVSIVGNCGLDPRADIDTMAGCNYINFVDAENRITSVEFQADVDRQTMELKPTLEISPDVVQIGNTVTISMFDYPEESDIDSILIAGRAVDIPAGLPDTGPAGQVSFTLEIPGVDELGNRLPRGTVRLEVAAGGEDEDAEITIAGANLSLSHDTVIANQDLTITGSGFTEGGDTCIATDGITFNNVVLQIDDELDCDNTAGDNGINVNNGGTFTLTVRVHDFNLGANVAISSSLLTEGTHELKIIDTSSAEGTQQVTVDERTLEVTPLASRPRDVVTIIGRRFIADNPDGVSTTVTVEYACGDNSRTATADPDVSGNFRETLRIPSGCAIPSTNTITATIDANGDTGIVETVTHEVPESLIRTEPGRGLSGSRVVLTGEGFRTFESVTEIRIGGLGVLGGRTPNTDANGDFSIDDVLVPGLDPGIHAVIVTVSTGNNETTSSTSFEVLESGLEGTPTPVADVYAMSESLLRIFRFDNSTKVWAFNDKRSEFADANTLDELVSGGVYWILIDQDVELDIDGDLLNLTCTGGDCWNLVVWP